MVVDCVGALAVDFWLQTHLHQCGVLWHLLLFLFNYDYTLEEGGVERSDDSNQQVGKRVKGKGYGVEIRMVYAQGIWNLNVPG